MEYKIQQNNMDHNQNIITNTNYNIIVCHTTPIYICSLGFTIKFNIDVYEPEYYKTSIRSINKSNREILSIVGVLVIDIHLVT